MGRGGKAWAWWVADFQTRKLYIGQIATSRLDGMQNAYEKLLHEAMAESCVYGLKEVVLWEPVPEVVEAGKSLMEKLGVGVRAIFEERTNRIPCVRLSPKIKSEREVMLIEPQLYAWS